MDPEQPRGLPLEPPERSPSPVGGSLPSSDSGAPRTGPPFSLELCCGSANLSAALRDVGIEAVGVDYVRNASRPRAPCVQLDLTSLGGQSLLQQLLRSRRVQYVHCAPPCGTASRARERPNGPPPLRSDEFPHGLPTLGGTDLLRVDAANAIYRFVSAFCLLCRTMGFPWSVENPTHSHRWACLLFPELCSSMRAQRHAHMHGSTSNRRMPTWTNMQQLASTAPRP